METVTIPKEEYVELKKLASESSLRSTVKRELATDAFGILKRSISERVSSVAYVNKLRKSWGRKL